jgi:hypothetical protein
MLRRLTLFLSTLLPISAQTYTETQVVKTQMQRPDGGGLFVPVGNPSIEGSKVVFFTLIQNTGVVDALWVADTDTAPSPNWRTPPPVFREAQELPDTASTLRTSTDQGWRQSLIPV